jgi:hypothetical protein
MKTSKKQHVLKQLKLHEECIAQLLSFSETSSSLPELKQYIRNVIYSLSRNLQEF